MTTNTAVAWLYESKTDDSRCSSPHRWNADPSQADRWTETPLYAHAIPEGMRLVSIESLYAAIELCHPTQSARSAGQTLESLERLLSSMLIEAAPKEAT